MVIMHALFTEAEANIVGGTGAIIPEGITFNQWAEIGRKIGQASTAFQMAVGDWLVYGQEHFEGSPALSGLERKAGRVSSALMDYACELTRMDRATLSDYAYVARKVPCSARAEQLTFRHYKVLAKLPEDEQREWIELATNHEERVPSRQLALSITLSAKRETARRIWSKDEIVADAADDKPAFIDAPEPILDRFIRSMKRQDFSEWTPEMKGHLWRKFRAAAEVMQEMGT